MYVKCLGYLLYGICGYKRRKRKEATEGPSCGYHNTFSIHSSFYSLSCTVYSVTVVLRDFQCSLK